MRLTRWVNVALFAALAASPRDVRAQAVPPQTPAPGPSGDRSPSAHADEPVELGVDATLTCTDRADFLERIRRRAPVTRPARQGESARVFIVRAEPSGDASVRGHLVVHHLDGSRSSRTLTGGSCDEVVDALAFVVAVDIDPRAATSPGYAEPLGEWQHRRPRPLTQPPSAPPRAAVGDPTALPSWRLEVGAHLAIVQGIVPVSLLSVPIDVELTRRSNGVFAPSFALGFERTFNATLAGPPGDAVLHIVQGFALACPLAWTIGVARFRPCLRFEAGALEGAGEPGKQVIITQRERRVWAGVSAVGRVGVRVYGNLHFDLQVGWGAPLVPRYQLQFDPGVPLGRVDAWHWRAGVGLRWHFL